jgi:hypothetical protein
MIEYLPITRNGKMFTLYNSLEKPQIKPEISIGTTKPGELVPMEFKILDLCSGLNGWSEIWKRFGYKVDTLDINPKFKPTFCMDVRDFKCKKGEYKIIFASPPCTFFSKANYSRSQVEDIEDGLEIAIKCFHLALNYTNYFVIENPYWKYGLYYYIPDIFRIDAYHHIIDYCMYGFGFKKPTSLWCNIPNVEYRRCIHSSHPQLNKTYSSKMRAKIPVSLSQHIYDSFWSFQNGRIG